MGSIKVRIKWEFDGKSGEFIEEFGYPEFDPKDFNDFWYTEGNGRCDCNRSRMCGLPEMPCGERIKFTEITPIQGR